MRIARKGVRRRVMEFRGEESIEMTEDCRRWCLGGEPGNKGEVGVMSNLRDIVGLNCEVL